MACPDPELIATYAEDRLDDNTRVALEAHADECGSCRRLMSAVAQLPRSIESTRAPEPPRDLEPGTVMGRYIVLYTIGRGAMGTVSAAYDPELDRKVALKILHAADDGRLVREARSLAKVSHPNVVRVHDVGEADGRVFVAMELVDGTNLREWLAAERRSWRDTVAMFRAAGRGLVASHERGLVHRDFKPQNVLISHTGDVLVTDFGLARVIGARSEHRTAPVGVAPAGSMTRGVFGTPAYIAPEQLAGQRVDERSDQFSFCVALYEALYDVRPFAGDSLDAIAASIARQELAPPRRRDVPRGLHKVIATGLATDPDARHPSLAALLQRLAATAARPRRFAIAAGSALVVAALVTWLAWPSHSTATCDASQIDEHWSPMQRDALARAFAVTQAPYAATTTAGATARLDAYRDAWSATLAASCRASQSPARRDLERDCLAAQLDTLDQLVASLAAATREDVRNAVAAVEKLPPPSVCRDPSYLDAKVKPPLEPAQIAAAAAGRRGLAAAQVAFDLGKYADAARLARGATIVTDYGPAVVEARLLHGKATAKLGDAAAAATELDDVAVRALALGLDRTAASAWIELVRVRGFDQSDAAAAAAVAKLARAALQRTSHDLVLASALENNIGVTKWFASDLDAADQHMKLAIELLTRARGSAPSVEVGMVTINRGIVAQTASRYADALALYERGVALLAATVGTEHPFMSAALENWGSALLDQDRVDEAQEKFERALAITEASLGADHPSLAETLANLAAVASRGGDHAAAIARFERAIEIATQADPQHPNLASLHHNIAEPLRASGRVAAAAAHLDVAIAAVERTFGKQHVNVAAYLTQRALLALELDRLTAARADLVRALALFDGAPEAKPEERADAAFAMAKLLAAERRDPTRARALAERALALYREHAADAPARAAIERWLADH